MVKGPKHLRIITAARLSNLLSTDKDIEFEKVFLGDMQNVMSVCNRLTADDKYSPLNRENFTQQIVMQLSQKRKTFPGFHAAFSTSRLNSPKKVDPHR